MQHQLISISVLITAFVPAYLNAMGEQSVKRMVGRSTG